MDERLVKHLYEKYYPGLFRYASKLVTAEYARDVINDVFVQLYQSGDAFSHDHKSAHTYLYRCIRNRCIDMLRKIAQYRRIPVSELGEDIVNPDMDIPSMKIGTIHRAIETLPPRMREIIKLGYMHYYSNEEIGEKLGIAHQTVRNEKSTALKKLRKLLVEDVN